MFGHRPDGKRLKKQDPIIRITPYLMPMRCDAQVFLEHKVDYEKLSRYIVAKSREGQKITFMQILVAAYVRAISRNPEANRFIFNKQYYARNNCSVSYTVLKDPQNTDSNETTVRILFDLTDTLFDVRDRMNAAIAANRGEAASEGFVSKLLNFLFAVPGLATVVVALVRFLDRFGLAPSVLMEELPFYVGMYVTNMASIGLHEVNHHLYNWGNVSLFFGIGTPEKLAVQENGETRMKRFLPIGITADERICSGAYYARFFNAIKRYLNHPELLEQPPESIHFDEGLEYHEPKPSAH